MHSSYLPCQKIAKDVLVLGAFLLLSAAAVVAETPAAQPSGYAAEGQAVPAASGGACEPGHLGSPYVNVDSWIYPAVLRLYSLGYVDHVFLGIRPWTRGSIAHMLEDAGDRLQDTDSTPAGEEAQRIYTALQAELADVLNGPCEAHQGHMRIESAYSDFRYISGTSLRDSFHLGSTHVNDYGRPYESGFNNYSGLSGYATAGPFTLYARGEFQRAPSAAGYSTALGDALSNIDGTYYTDTKTGLTNYYLPQATIPVGPFASLTRGRFLEAYVSALVLNHNISFGKSDQWLGPGVGGSFSYSNNAENIYGLEINRVEPLHIPLLSRVTGPFRYEFLVGSLRGHDMIGNPAYTGTTAHPNVISAGNPWVHLEKLSFRPTENLEFGFERTAIWGGKGHEPITLHTFLKSFFSFQNVSAAEKNGRFDPGARFGSFDFSYRLPLMRKWMTLYSDAEVHDDVSPIDAPRRAAWRPGLYLSHVPGVPRLDARVEVAWTDPPVQTSKSGRFMYWESLQKQGYTNNGQLFGDWIGREAKGGQAWLTWHLSGNEWIQVSARNQKAAKDFLFANGVQYGSTINDIDFQAVKRLGSQFEVNGTFKLEHYMEPIYLPGRQTVTSTNIRLTWYPERKVSF